MAVAPSPASIDDDRRLGSEYSNARTYLARAQRARVVARHEPAEEPQHGSNDSDFGMLDQVPD